LVRENHQSKNIRVFSTFALDLCHTILNNLNVIPSASPAYNGLRTYALPIFIVLMLMTVNVTSAVRVMGKGVLVMLMGSAGVVVGGVVSFFFVHGALSDDAWTGYGALAGSWIGGTGNMGAVSEALSTPAEQFGLAVLADNLVYIVWLPLLLMSKSFADRFNRWAKVPENRIAQMESAAKAEETEERPLVFQDYIFLGLIALAVTWISNQVGDQIYVWMTETFSEDSQIRLIFSASTIKVLILTTLSLILSLTPLRGIPGGRNIATAIIYLFVAGMGARASLGGLSEAPAFVAGAFIWIFIHGLFCLAGAKIFRVDIHSTAIASAANIGAAASAPVVAAYHRESLVPVSILMALIGYAAGNYLAILTAHLCRGVAGL